MTRYVIAPDVAIRLDRDEAVNIRSWPRAPPLAGAAAPLSGSTLRIALVEAKLAESAAGDSSPRMFDRGRSDQLNFSVGPVRAP
jgi:hypothetical protein